MWLCCFSGLLLDIYLWCRVRLRWGFGCKLFSCSVMFLRRLLMLSRYNDWMMWCDGLLDLVVYLCWCDGEHLEDVRLLHGILFVMKINLLSLSSFHYPSFLLQIRTSNCRIGVMGSSATHLGFHFQKILLKLFKTMVLLYSVFIWI